MKFIKSKFYIMGFLALMTGTMATAQEDTLINKFAIKSFSITPTNIFWSQPDGSSNSYFASYAIIADVTFAYNKNLITFAPSVGFEILGSSMYMQLNALYGREFRFSKRWFLEAHAGVGYLNSPKPKGFFDVAYDEEFQSTIGFPIVG